MMFGVETVFRSNYYLQLLIKSCECILFLASLRAHQMDDSKQQMCIRLTSFPPHNLVYAFLICFLLSFDCLRKFGSLILLNMKFNFIPIIIRTHPDFSTYTQSSRIRQKQLLRILPFAKMIRISICCVLKRTSYGLFTKINSK